MYTTTTTLTNRSSATRQENQDHLKTSATIVVAKNKSKDIRAMFKKIARKNAEQEPVAENYNVHSVVLID